VGLVLVEEGASALGDFLMVVPALEVLIASVSFCGILATWALSQVSTGDIDTMTATRKRKDGSETIGVDVEALLDEVQAKMHLPRQQLKMYWNSFSRYDVDGSGSVDSNELSKMLLDSIGYQPSPEDLTAIILDVDSDGSGTLEFPEFCTLVAKMDMGEQTQEDLKEAFMQWSEGKERISGELIKNALMNFGDKMTVDEVAEFMAEADVDKDGTIDFEEFYRAMAWRTQSSVQ